MLSAVLNPISRAIVSLAIPVSLLVFEVAVDPRARNDILTLYALGILAALYIATLLCLTALSIWLKDNHVGWRRLGVVGAILCAPVGVVIAMEGHFYSLRNLPVLLGGLTLGLAGGIYLIWGARKGWSLLVKAWNWITVGFKSNAQ